MVVVVFSDFVVTQQDINKSHCIDIVASVPFEIEMQTDLYSTLTCFNANAVLSQMPYHMIDR